VATSYDVTGTNDFYFWRHFLFLGIGSVAFLLALKFPLPWLRRWALPIFLAGIGLIILTLAIGETYGTAARLWLNIGGFSFQPVEAMKLAVITFLAAIFSSGKLDANSWKGGFIPFVVVLGIPSLLLAIQSDFGSLLVLVVTAGAMFFAAGANWKHFLGGMGAFAGGATILALAIPYIHRRVEIFLHPELDPLGAGFQVKQALIAIGSGGLFGRGFQNSIQKYNYLPEVQSDTIFAAISEEMGFLRILVLLGIYLFIAWRGFAIAQKATDEFEKILAVGLTTWIVGQAFINIAVNLALIPNTGITLPLVSYGGTSLLMTLIAFGILLQISGYQKEQRKRYHHA
jgi:cell division protein FtsW